MEQTPWARGVIISPLLWNLRSAASRQKPRFPSSCYGVGRVGGVRDAADGTGDSRQVPQHEGNDSETQNLQNFSTRRRLGAWPWTGWLRRRRISGRAVDR